jgi:hypothetical protein
MPQHGSSHTTSCLDLSDEYIEIWPDILAKSLNGRARVQEIDKLPVNINWGNHVELVDNLLISNEKIKQICVIYDEGYFILTGRKDISNKWSILIGHIFDTTNDIKHQEMEEIICGILCKLTINESNGSSCYFTNLTAWFRCICSRILKRLKIINMIIEWSMIFRKNNKK